MPLCKNIDDKTRLEVDKAIEEFSGKGYRTIAVARSLGGELDNIQLIGLIALADPPRPDSKEMIEEIRMLGIKPIMLTGDSLAIAREIAGRVGIGRNIITFADIRHLDQNEKIKKVVSCDGFAEIYPGRQVRGRETAPVKWIHGRYDRRWGERCSSLKASRNGHCSQ